MENLTFGKELEKVLVEKFQRIDEILNVLDVSYKNYKQTMDKFKQNNGSLTNFVKYATQLHWVNFKFCFKKNDIVIHSNMEIKEIIQLLNLDVSDYLQITKNIVVINENITVGYMLSFLFAKEKISSEEIAKKLEITSRALNHRVNNLKDNEGQINKLIEIAEALGYSIYIQFSEKI